MNIRSQSAKACFSDDYQTGVFTYVEEHNINRPLMIAPPAWL